jgi:hypothetical protein
MTAYRSYVTDYPRRVLDAWKRHLDSKLSPESDVSITLATISAAIGTPLELLGMVDEAETPSKSPWSGHADSKLDNPALDKLRSVRVSDFFASDLGPVSGFASWKYGEHADMSCLNTIDGWDALKPEATPPIDLKCWKVLRVLRHASAHGNIRVRATAGEITQIVLLNFPRKEPNCKVAFVAVGPDDLLKFVHRWSDFLEVLEALSNTWQTALEQAESSQIDGARPC